MTVLYNTTVRYQCRKLHLQIPQSTHTHKQYLVQTAVQCLAFNDFRQYLHFCVLLHVFAFYFFIHFSRGVSWPQLPLCADARARIVPVVAPNIRSVVGSWARGLAAAASTARVNTAKEHSSVVLWWINVDRRRSIDVVVAVFDTCANNNNNNINNKLLLLLLRRPGPLATSDICF